MNNVIDLFVFIWYCCIPFPDRLSTSIFSVKSVEIFAAVLNSRFYSNAKIAKIETAAKITLYTVFYSSRIK